MKKEKARAQHGADQKEATKKGSVGPALDPQAVHFIPLGGAEQFGVNLNVYAHGGRYLAVDLGIGFADEHFPGIDILLPDVAFLEERRAALEALIITHAHEDHVGAVPYLLSRLQCPVYATRFTAKVLRRKIEELGPKNAQIQIISPGDVLKFSDFTVRVVHVAHSIPDSCALVIDTPAGRVVHSGDWHLDPTPVIGTPTDWQTLKSMGDSGVMAYIGDSTNAEVPGRAGTEQMVEQGLEAVFREHDGRIAVTCFSSHIGRIQSICKAAKASGRVVGLVGFSLRRMVEAAQSCALLSDVDFPRLEDVMDLPPGRVALIVSGSQGEARAALARIARRDHPHVRLDPGDTVIFSSRAIPGNEKNINAVRNNLVASGIRVVTSLDTAHKIHISGHPCREEIAEMFSWLRPALVVPVHGERAQLEAHAALARDCQVPCTVVPENGSIIRLGPGAPEVVGHVETGLIAVDQNRLIPAGHASIGERRKLQFSGAVHVSVVLDARGDLLAEPSVSTMGLVDSDHAADADFDHALIDEIVEIFEDMTAEDRRDDDFVHEELRIGVRRFVQHRLGLKPKATVHVVRL